MIGEVKTEWKGDAWARRLIEAANVALTATVEVLADAMVNKMGGRGGQGQRSAPGQPPNTDYSALSKSFGYSRSTQLTALAGTPLAYAKFLELGAVIKAKKKALLIPMSRETSGMVAQSDGSSARGLQMYLAKYGKKVARIKSRKGGVWIGHYVGGRKARFVFSWLMTAQTTIKPRPFMRPAFEQAKADGTLLNTFKTTLAREMV